MRVIGSAPSLRLTRNPAVGFVAFCIVLVAAYETAQFILDGDLGTLVFTGMVCAAGAVAVAILNDWRRGLYLLLAWIMFEDFFRKYLGNNMAIYFGKDILALVLYLSFFVARRNGRVKTFNPPFLVLLLIFFWYCVMQIFNPASTSFFYGLLGMKVDFLYVPLIFVGYALVDTEAELRRFFAFNSILVLIVVALGIAQSIIGPTFLNPHSLQEDIRDLSTTYRAAPISGLVAYRPTSVFVSAGRFQNLLTVSWIISLGYGGYLLLRSKKGRSLAFVCVAMVAVGSIMSVSRGVFMWSASSGLVIAAGFLWGAPWKQREVLRVLRAIQRVLLFSGTALLLMITIFPNDIGARFAVYSETLSPSSPASELVFRARDYPFKNLMLAFEHERWPYGYGTGTATLGIQYVAHVLHQPPMNIGVENGYGQLLVELGIVGLLLWIFLSIAISFSAWKVAKSLRGTPWFPLGFVIFWYVFLLTIPLGYISFISYQDYVMNAYFWILLGILFRLPELAQKAISGEFTLDAPRRT